MELATLYVGFEALVIQVISSVATSCLKTKWHLRLSAIFFHNSIILEHSWECSVNLGFCGFQGAPRHFAQTHLIPSYPLAMAWPTRPPIWKILSPTPFPSPSSHGFNWIHFSPPREYFMWLQRRLISLFSQRECFTHLRLFFRDWIAFCHVVSHAGNRFRDKHFAISFTWYCAISIHMIQPAISRAVAA